MAIVKPSRIIKPLGMLHSAQIRAARALLGWRQEQLAGAAGTGLATIRRLEGGQGLLRANVSTAAKIQAAFEQAGIQFLFDDDAGGMGLRMRKTETQRERKGR